MKVRILCTDGFGGEGLRQLQTQANFEVDAVPTPNPKEWTQIIPQYDAVVIRSASHIDASLIEKAQKLRIIARAGIGTDNIDVDRATEKGIFVVNAPSGNTTSTAELTIAMMLGLARHLPQAAASMAAGQWEKKRFKGSEVAHKTLGIIGLGRIGRVVSAYAKCLKMKVTGHDPFLKVEQFENLGITRASLEEIYREADYITLHTPLNDQTRDMIGKKEIELMKPTARIINCARGGLVNENALAQALREKRIAGAALDVYTAEPYKETLFQDLPNCVTTPHLGASTAEAQEAVGLEIAEALIDYFREGLSRTAVNLPGVDRDTFKTMQPQLQLMQRLGRAAAQLVDEPIRTISFAAPMRQNPLLTRALVKGVMAEVLDHSPSYVNALKRAKERGIEVVEQFGSNGKDPRPRLTIKIGTASNEITLTGRVYGEDELRFTAFNEYDLDVQPKGHLLFMENSDKPGVIGRVCTLIGDAGINIAEMQNVRRGKGSQALTVIRIDAPIPLDGLGKISAVDGVSKARVIALDAKP